MSVNVSKLAGLFKDKKFQKWMQDNMPSESVQASDAGPGAAAQAQAIGVYNKISSSQLKDEFHAFIEQNYPGVASVDVDLPLTARLMVPAGKDANRVFGCYHPNLLRFPMQMMFRSPNQGDLKQVVYSFMSQLKSAREQLTIRDTAYIEYLPGNLTEYTIPDDNWEIKVWKNKNNTR